MPERHTAVTHAIIHIGRSTYLDTPYTNGTLTLHVEQEGNDIDICIGDKTTITCHCRNASPPLPAHSQVRSDEVVRRSCIAQEPSTAVNDLASCF